MFDGLRKDQPEQLQKLICVSGDMSMPQLGISENDLQRMYREVNIVIHAAATVRFDEPVHVAVNMNTLGTQQIMQMCLEMKQLKVKLLKRVEMLGVLYSADVQLRVLVLECGSCVDGLFQSGHVFHRGESV